MTRRFVLIVMTTIAATVASPRAQTPRDPASAATPPTSAAVSGTAVVSGVVISADSPPKPLRRVTVSLVSSDFRVPFSTVSDNDGRWTMTNVTPGYYSVVASKPSYLGAFFGSTRPGRGPGVPVGVANGARVSGLSLTLARGGVIAGVLKLPTGQPANNMPVAVVEVETVAGVRRLRLAGGRTSTNDRGEFRVFGLPPGDYLIQGQPSGLLTGALTNTNDATQTTSADVSWAEQLAQRGRSGSTAASAAPVRGKNVNYATVYFPGTTDPAAAAVVTLGPGEERRGIDFALALVATAKVSGVVTGPDGQPLGNVQISLTAPEGAMNLRGLLIPRAAITSGADGSFAVLAVPPGRYQLTARSANGDWALQDFGVDGRDLGGVALAMQPGLTVRGRLTFDATSLPAPGGADIAKARVTLSPAGGNGAADALTSIAASVTAPVAADGSFVVSGLAPFLYRVSITMPGVRATPSAPAGGWTLRTLAVGATDLSDRPLDLRARQAVDGVVATFTDRPATLAGTLTDQTNQPASGYPIVVFATTKTDWIPASRRIAVARPSTDGSFRLIGLPAGAYYLCAVVNLDPSDLEDPVFLEQLSRSALTITLTEGATVTQNLKIAGR